VKVDAILGSVATIVMSIIPAATYADCLAYLSVKKEIAIAIWMIPSIAISIDENPIP